MENIVAKVKQKIDALLKEKDFVIVAIDGKCTSGKTTLAAKFAEVGGNVDYERFSEEVLTLSALHPRS